MSYVHKTSNMSENLILLKYTLSYNRVKNFRVKRSTEKTIVTYTKWYCTHILDRFGVVRRRCWEFLLGYLSC